MEYNDTHSYASKGTAGAGLGFGIAGTALGVLNSGLGNILGGGWNNGWNNGYSICSDNTPVNRYELNQQNEIASKDMEIAYLKGREASKEDDLKLYQYVDGRLRSIESQISQQAVVNAQIAANLSCMQGQIAVFNGLTKTVVPIGNVCPTPMMQYNSWVAPTVTGTTPVEGGTTT